MKIVIVGAGGVGAFFGALLARAGVHDVRFVVRHAHLDALSRGGIRIRSALLGDVEVPHVTATDRPGTLGQADLVLVCVKAHQTAGVLDSLAPVVGDGTLIVSLQNGVDSDDVLAARFGRARVVPAAVYVGATLEEPGVVDHAAEGRIVIGARPGVDASRLPAIRDALASSGCPIEISDDIQRDRWNKLVWNAAFNSTTAVTGRAPHELLAIPETRALVVGIMDEVVAVARAGGITLPDGHVAAIVSWTERMPALRTSTQVDRQRGREMETDALLGVLVRKGRELGVPTPLAGTLHALMLAMDAPGG